VRVARGLLLRSTLRSRYGMRQSADALRACSVLCSRQRARAQSEDERTTYACYAICQPWRYAMMAAAASILCHAAIVYAMRHIISYAATHAAMLAHTPLPPPSPPDFCLFSPLMSCLSDRAPRFTLSLPYYGCRAPCQLLMLLMSLPLPCHTAAIIFHWRY